MVPASSRIAAAYPSRRGHDWLDAGRKTAAGSAPKVAAMRVVADPALNAVFFPKILAYPGATDRDLPDCAETS
jgi:hypothetical protein